MKKMIKSEYEEGIKSQINEDDLRLQIKRNKKLEKKIEDMQITIDGLVESENQWYRKVLELEKRAESYKSQLIVYKGLYEKVIDKLIGKDNERNS